MVKEIIARGQATITTQQDSYTITQSICNYTLIANVNGTIPKAVSFTSTLKVTSGNTNVSSFTIGPITKPPGFSAIAVDNTNKTISYSIAANTTTLADNGHIIIPLIIEGVTYYTSFNWSKSKTGQPGSNGVDGYTLKSSRQGYSIATDKDGRVHTAITTSTVISALKGKTSVAPIIGTLPSVPGCTLSKSGTMVTIIFTAGTSLAENGIIDIPVTVDGLAFQMSFTYAKARTGANGSTGAAGVDANMLDWVKDWNSNKTVIGTNSVVTPKIFAGIKNPNGTLTGTAIGRFSLSTLNASGAIITETIDGVYGFRNGYATFSLNNTGNVQLGRGNQCIRYNAATGRIEFGSDVTLNWVNAINTAKTEAINTAATTAQSKADAAKNAAISVAATDAANKVNAIRIGGCNYIRNSSFSDNLTGVSAEGTTVSIDTATLYNNYRTLKVIQNTPCTDANAASQRTYFTAINSKVCLPASFSMYVKGSVAGTMKIRIGGTGIQVRSVITSWQRITLENITPTSAVVLFGFQTAGIYWCALPMLVQGSKAIDWSPAPEDIAGHISDAKKAGTDARAVADAITDQADSEGWATKLTYIGSTGIFTGALSANIVNTLKINASQITSGTIEAARINVEALKTCLITAGNIEALVLNVTKGKIGGWSLDADSIYRGTKNNNPGACTAASGTITIGSNGIRGFKWRLDATGAGAVAGGNIAWDVAGNVTFGPSVTLNWTNAASTAANTGKLYVRGTGYNHVATRYIGLNGTKIHESSSRGLTLSIINRNDLKVVSHTNYDVYASDTNCNSLATALDAIDSTKIVILTSFDAIRINPALSAAIQRCGGSDSIITNARVPYVLIGIPGIGMNQGLTSIYGTETTAPFAEISTVIVNGIPQGINANGKLKTYLTGTGIYTGTLTAQQVNAVDINAGSIKAGTLSTDRLAARAITAVKIAAGTITATEINVASIQASVVTATVVNGLTCTFNKGTIAGWTISSSQVYKNSVFLGADGSITNSTKWKLNNDGSGLIANGNISWNAAGAVTFGTSVSLQWKNDIESAKTTNYGYRYYKKIVLNGHSGTYYPVIFKGGDQSIKRDILIRRSYGEQAPSDWDNNSTTHKGGLSLLLKVNFGGWGGVAYSWDIYELSEMYSRMFAGAAYCGNNCMFAIFLRGGGDAGAAYHIYSDQAVESDAYSPSPIPPAPQIAYNKELIFDYLNSKNYAPAPRTLTAAVEEEIRRHRFINLALGNDSTLHAHPLTYIGSTGIYTGTLTANQVNAVAINATSITAGTLSADRIAAGSINASKLNATSIKTDIVNAAYINGLSCTFVRGTIGGWVINSSQISKNNVCLGADGAIYNGTKWRLGNDGSGRLAGGNIAWDAAGNVSFASSVSLNWTNAATSALDSAKSYADTKKTEAVNAAAADATAKADSAKELALATAFGKMLCRDPEFRQGNNGTGVYNNNGNGTVSIVRTGLSNAPNDSKMVLEIRNTGSASPGCGGFYFATMCSNRKVFITRIIAKIPIGRNIQWASNAIGTSGSSKWLTPNAGTGDWAEYVYKVTSGTSSFSSTNFFYLDGPSGSTASPLIWHVAYATVFDLTSSEQYTTTIDSNGIYTGTIRANQVIVDSALVVGGSYHDGSISVRDAGNNVMATLDRSGITAVAGNIGGWNIKSGSIYACAPAGGHRVFITSSGYIYNDDGSKDYWGLRADGSATFGHGKILFDNDGSGYVAGQNIKWDSKGNVEVKGNISANSGLIAGFTISGNKLVNTASDSSIEFSSLIGNASLIINSYSALLSLRADSARTGIYLQTYAAGAKGIYIIANAGSKYAIESYGPIQFGQRSGERWNVPGVLYIGYKYNSGSSAAYRRIWGDGLTITSSSSLGDGKFRFYHNLRHTDYTVFVQSCQSTVYYGFFRLLERTSTSFLIQNISSSGRPDGSPFDFTIMGRNCF